MYLVVYEVGNRKEFFTDKRPYSLFWSFKKAEAFLFATESDAKIRIKEICPQIASRPEMKIQFIHPLNLPQK